MKQVKRLLALVLVLATLMGALPMTAEAANADSGDFGNLSWALSSSGTLTISGKGAMPDKTSDMAETFTILWHPQLESISSIVIKDGVTKIGAYAFSDCYNAKKITVPSSVTSIGAHAFSGCGKLTGVTIPNKVAKIEDFTFAYCESLTDITIPNSVTSIGYGAFKVCSGLKRITIPNSVVSIEGEAFAGCEGLTSITIPSSVTIIGESAFSGCEGLTISGYTGSATEKYAKNNGITFIALETPTILSTPSISKVANVTGGVQITWGKVSGAAKYQIFRKTSGGNWTTVGNTTATSYTDKTVKAGTKYFYTVRCVSSDGKTYTSNYDTTGKSITVPAAAGSNLATPTITAIENIAKGTSGIKMNWGKVSGASKYEVYRRKHGSNGWQKIATVTSPTYTDTSVRWMTGTLYDYSVVAVSSSARSSVAPTKTILRMAAPAITGLTNSAAKTIKAIWSQNKAADGYQIWYQVGENASSRKIVTVYGSGTLSRTISNLTKGNSYKVFVRSFKNVNGVYYYSAWSASRTVKVSK